MEVKALGASGEQEGCEGLERLMEQGRALHSRAVYETLVLMVNGAKTSLKKCWGISPGDRDLKCHSPK